LCHSYESQLAKPDEAFSTAYPGKSFSEAALQLEISQSAVSHAISILEADLGVVLFSRGRHGAHPTPVGGRVTH